MSIPVRRVRELIDVLVEHGLIEKKKVPGYANRYKVNPGKLVELTKEITFKYRSFKSEVSYVPRGEKFQKLEEDYLDFEDMTF